MIADLIKTKYGLSIETLEKSTVGAGSDCYFATCSDGKYVIKFPSESEMNNPELEPNLCDFLLRKGLPVCEFIKNCSGDFLSADHTGRVFHVQKFFEGKTYDLNTAPPWLLKESAQTLGKIHTALSGYVGLGEGIGINFFRNMIPETAAASYQKTLQIAQEQEDIDIEQDLLYRIDLMRRFPCFAFDTDKLTCKGTHGDYFISQLICGENKINAVIDWTTACVHPVVWEIMRSYLYASPACKDGAVSIPEFVRYVETYLEYAALNAYDVETMPSLFYYQIAVCDYYNQYYQSTADNRHIYLHQAVFSTKLLKWLEENRQTLTNALMDSFIK